MKFTELAIKGIYLIEVKKIEDSRGFFFRTYCANEFEEMGLDLNWKQANHSFTAKKGTFRGVHYQIAPYQEYKLIRCLSGGVVDFGIDLRKGSPTLFEHVSVELNSENNNMLLLAPGIGHAFQSVEDNTALVYMHTSIYKPSHEGGIFYDDKKIKLPLPLPISEISERDSNYLPIPDNFGGIDFE